MPRLRRWSALASLLAAGLLLPAGGRAPADKEKPPPAEKKEEKWLVDRAVTGAAAAAPVPALRYRLFPATPERKEGNAAPMYLRFFHERTDAWKKELQEKPPEWNKLPLDELPLDEVKKFLAGHRYNLRQLELGARRTTADWSYTLEDGNPINMLLPDVHGVRQMAPLLVLKARVEIREGRHADAVRTLETGFSFSRQISEAPLLISALVGLGTANQFADALLELSERPAAPNLYWALAVIPRPLIDLRKAVEVEQKLLEMQFPDLADVDRPRPAEEWDAALRRVRREYERLVKGSKSVKPTKPGNRPADPASKSPDLPEARKYLASAGVAKGRLDKMTPAEVLLRHAAVVNKELSDEVTKGTYLPYHKAVKVFAEANKRLKAAPDTAATRLSLALLPAMDRVVVAQARVERKLAALQAIEALRMHAAAKGELPDKLAQVTVVPVPDDPGTGKAFEYNRDGRTATLVGRLPGEPLEATGQRYRVTLRK
jgi:hypothetical protein